MKRSRDTFDKIDKPSSKREKVSNVTIREYDLHKDGFVIYRNVLEITPFILQKIKDIEKSSNYEFIFNNEKNDLKRTQINVDYDNPLSKEILKITEPFYTKIISKDHYFKNMVVLKSEAECEEQIPHTDYVLSDDFLNLKSSELPLAMIVPLQDNTYFNVWPEAINFKDNLLKKSDKFKKNIVNLSKGDLVFFRGDLVHAGAYFPKKNYRIHTYIDSKHFKRKYDTTFYIKEDGEKKFGKKFVDQFTF